MQELHERLSQVEGWKKRREEIDRELAQVWVEGGEQLAPPPYGEEEVTKEQDEHVDESEGKKHELHDGGRVNAELENSSQQANAAAADS